MQIDTRMEGTTVYIAPVGDIDYVTAPELDAVLEEQAAKAEMIVLDMAGVGYIASAGLRSILNADELMEDKGGFKLVNVGAEVKAIFDMTNFTSLLDIE